MKRLTDHELVEVISMAKQLGLEDFLVVLLCEIKRRNLNIAMLEQVVDGKKNSSTI